jgi:hypothetical protein
VAGLPTTWGVPALAQAIVPIDAPVVERMRMAGAIPIGRTNLPDQDHTTSPPATHAARRSAPSASSAFRSTFVTTAIRPLCRRGTRGLNHNFRNAEDIYFLPKGWTIANDREAPVRR